MVIRLECSVNIGTWGMFNVRRTGSHVKERHYSLQVNKMSVQHREIGCLPNFATSKGVRSWTLLLSYHFLHISSRSSFLSEGSFFKIWACASASSSDRSCQGVPSARDWCWYIKFRCVISAVGDLGARCFNNVASTVPFDKLVLACWNLHLFYQRAIL